MSKKKTQALPRADKYEYIGKMGEFFVRGRHKIKLATITDKYIDMLMNEDAAYWTAHFREKKKAQKPVADK